MAHYKTGHFYGMLFLVQFITPVRTGFYSKVVPLSLVSSLVDDDSVPYVRMMALAVINVVLGEQ
jgi:hypothetical protein